LRIVLIQKLAQNRVQIVAANVGDARVVLGHNNGTAERLTRDHKADNDDEVERIRQAGGFCFKGRVSGVLAVTRSLGDFYLKDFVIAEPYVSEQTISIVQAPPQPHQRSFVVLACDGLWDVMSDQEVVDFVRSFPGERNQVAKCLIKEALQRGSADNITAVVAMLV
jgi:serine/threonine protein phosphatase PrpC